MSSPTPANVPSEVPSNVDTTASESVPDVSDEPAHTQPATEAAASSSKEAPVSSRRPASERSSARSRTTPRSRSTPRSARTARASTIADRPAWDDTPLRPRPPALRGLRASEGISGREPWARDESVYNRNFAMWSDYDGHFNLEARSPYTPHRVNMAELQKEAYMGRWRQKFEIGAGTLMAFDGNPFT